MLEISMFIYINILNINLTALQSSAVPFTRVARLRMCSGIFYYLPGCYSRTHVSCSQGSIEFYYGCLFHNIDWLKKY